ncbi:MAG: TIGR04076 family protein [Candidatus Hodarchaeales archaeon]|jgi:uncharacterized repeat protein (TIGR04076 family)
MVRENIKITVFKKVEPEYVFGHEVTTDSGGVITSCPIFEEGNEFITEGLNIPEGFTCTSAWSAIFRSLSILFWGGDFDGFLGPGLTYTSCSDGVRPVVFKLERLEKLEKAK